MATQNTQKQIKVGATVLVLGALVLQLMQLVMVLPALLQGVANITQVILVIHAVEGLVAAMLIFRYKLRTRNGLSSQSSSLLLSHLPESFPLAVIKAGLYVFFVGTVGLVEIMKEMKAISSDGQLVK